MSEKEKNILKHVRNFQEGEGSYSRIKGMTNIDKVWEVECNSAFIRIRRKGQDKWFYGSINESKLKNFGAFENRVAELIETKKQNDILRNAFPYKLS